MTYDLNKKILGIDYNYLNLPIKINLLGKNDFLNVLYQYDAAGNKRVKQTRINGRIIKTTNYIGNFVYEDGIFKYLLTSEGRIVPIAGEMVYQYFITDHLGNNRVMFDQDNLIKQQSSYYPFGMLITHKQSPDATYDYNRYLYNGKELQDDFDLDWYDYGARFYDPQLGRWHVIDNKAAKYVWTTPYTYCLNNPIIFIDPDGEDVVVVLGGLDMMSQGDAGTAADIANDLNTWATDNNIKDFSAKPFVSDAFDNVKDNIMSYINDNYDAESGEKLIISGYSWGGDTSVELAEALKEAGIDIDLLITVDAAKGPRSGGNIGDGVDREIPNNVKEATNYYQDKPSPLRSHGAEATAADPSKTSVMNVKVTTEGTEHGNIDEQTRPLVVDEIKAKVGGR